MGFRCPGCGKDFGLDREALYHHFNYESGECAGYAYAAIAGVKRMCSYKSQADKAKAVRNRVSKSYTRISDAHHWEKQNLISDKDGYDIVVCSRCGIRAKRCMDSYKFDMRQSMKKIENCIDNHNIN